MLEKLLFLSRRGSYGDDDTRRNLSHITVVAKGKMLGCKEKPDNFFQGKRCVAALIAAMTLLSGAGFTASVASADTDTVGYETDRIAFSGARTVCGEGSIDFAALTRSRMFLIDGGAAWN